MAETLDAATRRRAALFGAMAERYDAIIPYFAEFGRRLVETVDVRPGAAVIDVACGRGASLLPAARRAGPDGRVLGVDAAEPMLTVLRRDVEAAGLPGVTLEVMDAQRLAVADGEFDVALCGSALFLMGDPARAAAELRRVLRAGGRVGVSVPDESRQQWDFLRPTFAAYWERAGLPGTPWPAGTFDAPGLLRAAGFTDVAERHESATFLFADADAWWDWIHTMGWRAALDRLPVAVHDALHDDLAARLAEHTGPGGLPLTQTVRLLTARAA